MDRQLKRYEKYLAVLGDREAMPVEELARTLGYPEKRVERDLGKMIDKGYFGGTAYLNMELGYLFRSGKADEALKKAAAKGRLLRSSLPRRRRRGTPASCGESEGQRRHCGPGPLCQDRPAGGDHFQNFPGGGRGPPERKTASGLS